MKTTKLLGIVGPTLLLAFSPDAFAQSINPVTEQCNGETLTGGAAADVIIGKKGCTLDGVKVFGSVKSDKRGAVTLTNGTTVDGSVEVTSGGDVTVTGGGTDVGELRVEGNADVVITDNARVAAVFKFGSGTITLETGATIFPGGIAAIESGTIDICGSNVGVNGAGGITLLNVSGDLNVDVGTNCGRSNIEGTIIAEKLDGNIHFDSANLIASDLIVIDQLGSGKVTLVGDPDPETDRIIKFSDINISGGMGAVTITNAETDSDTSISERTGLVTISDTTLGSDVSISLAAGVTLRDNNFSLEDVILEKNSGPVRLEYNNDLGVNLIENNDVTLIANMITDATIDKNKDGVSLTGNTFAVLKCSDNTPPPTGTGNTVTELADGQCSKFK